MDAENNLLIEIEVNERYKAPAALKESEDDKLPLITEEYKPQRKDFINIRYSLGEFLR